MRTNFFWKRYLIGLLILVLTLLTGCTIAANEPTATPESTAAPPTFSEGTEFPTGIFKRTSTTIEFHKDGTCLWSSLTGWEVPCKYGVNGNLYSEMTFEYGDGPQVPVTYYWTFDGEKLTFRLMGVDLRDHRRAVTNGKSYRFSGEIEASSEVKEIEFPTGRFADQSGLRSFEFHADGTWSFFENNMEVPAVSGRYVSNGDLYTEMTHDNPDYPQVPVTYYWTYDGEALTFQLWGEDVYDHRRSMYDGQTYTKSE